MTTVTDARLSTAVKPRRYVLNLTPDLVNFTFSGEIAIDIEVAQPSADIVLHALELDIAQVQVALPQGATLAATTWELNEETETVMLHFPQPVPAGEAVLRMEFTGTLNDQLRGFYRSQYAAADGSVRYLATTQFEATDARRAFPCWDEPAMKATFQVTLVVPQEMTAVSNLPVASETPAEGGRKAVRFDESPLMSTYLLAFVVGDLACVEAPAANGTLVRVWTTRGKEEQGRYALENSVKLLSYFNDYFGVPYPLAKLDHIAIPDFAAGAMENWGAITYRETALLYDPANSAAGTRQRILEVVSHEMAHMWFGDLVTMEWWDDLWLNESFASWMGDKAVDAIYPEWEMWTQFVSSDSNSGLGLDGLRNSHPVEVPVSHPAQIREIFDAISYSKGGSVLRMLEDYLGEASFRDGLRRYIAAHEYGNARTGDLWTALAAASGQPVAEVMDSWIHQTGYPVLEPRIRRDEAGLRVQVRQRRFLYDHLIEPTEDATVWKIPVGVAQNGVAGKITQLLDAPEAELTALGGGHGGWTSLNPGRTGFYRVHYPTEALSRLRGAVERKELPATDRLGLQDDAYALMRAGYLSGVEFLNTIEAYRGEDDAIVLGDVAGHLHGLGTMIVDEPFLASFDAFGRMMFEGIARRVGWDAAPGEGHLDALRRSTVLSQAGFFGDAELLEEARRRFDRYMQDGGSLHPDLRAVAIGLTAQQGDEATYELLWERGKAAELQEEKLRFLRALGRFSQPALLQRTLERSLTPDVRSQDTVSLIGAVATNRKGRDLTWQFVKDNWAELDRRYGRGGFSITSIVSVGGGFTTLERAAEVEEFFQTHPAPSAERTVQQTLERIRLNARWLELNRAGLAEWFAGR